MYNTERPVYNSEIQTVAHLSKDQLGFTKFPLFSEGSGRDRSDRLLHEAMLNSKTKPNQSN